MSFNRGEIQSCQDSLLDKLLVCLEMMKNINVTKVNNRQLNQDLSDYDFKMTGGVIYQDNKVASGHQHSLGEAS